MSIDSVIPTQPRLAKRERWLLAAHALFFIIFMLPFLPHETLPLADYNNHLARSFITHDPESVSGIYYLKWGIAPYFADLLPQLFIGMFGIYVAAKINFFIGLLTIIVGVLLISRHVFGQISPATLIIYIFLYNLSTMLGFVNYNLAMGLALISFYLWLKYPKHTQNW